MGAAMVMVMPPYHGATFRFGEAQVRAFYQGVSDRIGIPIMIQDAPAAGTPLSPAFLAGMAREIEQVSYFKMETAGAAGKLRELIALGGEAVEGPWDGEEAITLLADLEAGVTGSMTGGGYADGIRPIIEAHRRGDVEAAYAQYQRWLPLINHENRQAGFLAAKALMKEGGVIACDARARPGRRCIPRRAGSCWRSRAGWTRWCCAGALNASAGLAAPARSAAARPVLAARHWPAAANIAFRSR